MNKIALWLIFSLTVLVTIIMGILWFIGIGFICTAMFGMNRWLEYYVTIVEYLEERKWLVAEVNRL